jgi:nucleoside-diphosphate-sugar epimerase
MKRLLITGAAGFVGCHLARRLSDDQENHLLLVDDFSRGKRDEDLEIVLGRSNVSILAANLTDPGVFEQIGKGFDEVYHLAAIIGVKNVLTRPYEVVHSNALTTLHLLDWFRQGGGKKLLFSSTSEVYAWTQQFYALPIPTPEQVPLSLTELANARSAYAGSKIFGELAITHGCAASGKSFVIVRYHNVYGPRMGFDHVIPELFQRALQGQNPLIVYSANHTRAFCYISDAVDATIRAMRSQKADGATINIGNDREEVSMRELAGRVLRQARLEGGIEERHDVGDPIARRCPDITTAGRLLSFRPQVGLDEGLEKTFAWYRSRVEPRKN